MLRITDEYNEFEGELYRVVNLKGEVLFVGSYDNCTAKHPILGKELRLQVRGSKNEWQDLKTPSSN